MCNKNETKMKYFLDKKASKCVTSSLEAKISTIIMEIIFHRRKKIVTKIVSQQ